MPTREEMIQQLKRKRLMDEVQARRDADPLQKGGGSPQEEFGVGEPDQPKFTGSLMNFADKIPIIGRPATWAIGRAASGVRSLEEGTSYDEALAKTLAEQSYAAAQLETNAPGMDLASSFAAGAMLPMVGAGRIKPLFKSRAGQGALNIAGRGAEGAAVSGADALTRGQDVSDAAMVGGAFGTGAKALGQVARGTKNIVRDNYFGVRPETEAKYLARPAQINAVSEESLVDEIGLARSKFADDVTGTKEAARTDIAQKSSEKKAAVEARRQAYQDNIDTLKAEDIPSTFPREISRSISNLQKDTSRGSSAAFDVLKEQDTDFPVGPLKGYLTNQLTGMKLGDALMPTPETGILSKYRDFLDETKLKRMRPEELKVFLQTLDNDVADSYAKRKLGEKPNSGDKALMAYRRFVDSKLKENDAYRDAMLPVAERTSLLGDAREAFSDEDQTTKMLRGLSKPEMAGDRNTLKRLGEYDKKNYLQSLGDYENAQTILGSTRNKDAVYGFMPETKAAQVAEESLSSARSQWADKIKAAEQTFEPIKGLNPQSAVRRVVSEGRPDFAAQKRLGALDKMTGNDFMQSADDLGVQRALKQGFTRGSRNTNLNQASVGALLGKIFKNDAAGQGLGALLGGMADLSGPAAYQSLMDLTLNSKFRYLASKFQRAYMLSPNAFSNAVRQEMASDPEFNNAVQGMMPVSEEQGQVSPDLKKKVDNRQTEEQRAELGGDTSGMSAPIPGVKSGMGLLRKSMQSVFGDSLDTSMDVADFLMPETYGELAPGMAALPPWTKGAKGEIKMAEAAKALGKNVKKPTSYSGWSDDLSPFSEVSDKPVNLKQTTDKDGVLDLTEEQASEVRNRFAKAKASDTANEKKVIPFKSKNDRDADKFTDDFEAYQAQQGELGKTPKGKIGDNLPLAKSTVDGREVLGGEIPNMGSISASLDDYKILEGVREIGMDNFSYSKPISVSEAKRTDSLMEEIKASKKIRPLIVVEDVDGFYILEGGHRFDALHMLGAKSFPAIIVKDLGKPKPPYDPN